MTEEPAPHDAHVIAADRLFRGAGITIAAMAHPRCADALAAIRRFNGLPDGLPEPFTMRFHPNEWCAANWRKVYP